MRLRSQRGGYDLGINSEGRGDSDERLAVQRCRDASRWARQRFRSPTGIGRTHEGVGPSSVVFRTRQKHLKAIARDSSVRTFYEGATIVQEGQQAANCFVIVEGSAAVTKHGLPVAVLGPGDVIGESAMSTDA